jgi:hypothetical protein
VAAAVAAVDEVAPTWPPPPPPAARPVACSSAACPAPAAVDGAVEEEAPWLRPRRSRDRSTAVQRASA